MGVNHTTAKSFGFAFEGVKTALKNEPNLRVHITFGALALLAAVLLGFTTYEWLILAITIFFVLALELLNTALESIVNLISPKKNPVAKAAKDVSAAMVLFASIMALFVGGVLFLPKIAVLLQK